ncbi:MAG TPA: hypothetical protein VGR87_08480 [Candidatus Limnocylindria bacterium]|nr:hypothetical protein [Candidatus Limnocylindria bacterium]
MSEPPGLTALLAVVLIGALVVFAPLYLHVIGRELSRPRSPGAARALARADLAGTDPAYPGSSAFRYPFELFSRGIEQTCENVMSGTVYGVAVTAFDFLYVQRVDSDGTPENDVRSEPIRHSCALATVAGYRPHVVIEPAAAPRSSRADGEPVELEWGDFNARYRVISPERPFATALLDVELMAWLVDEARASS